MSLSGPVVAFVATLLLAATPGVAGERHAVEVRHADLDLASADGRRAFERRVAATARLVCAIDPGERQPAILMLNRQCLRDAVASARPATELAVARARAAPVAVAGAAEQ